MQFTGKITDITPLKALSNGESSIQFIVTELNPRNPQFPSSIVLEIYGNQRIQQINPVMGMIATFNYDVSARRYNESLFGSNRCWGIANNPQAQGGFAPQSAPMGQPYAPQGAPQFGAPQQPQYGAPQGAPMGGYPQQQYAPQGAPQAPQFGAPQGQPDPNQPF